MTRSKTEKGKISMKMTKVQIPVAKNEIQMLPDPTGNGHDTYYAYVRIANLPMDLPMDVNPRNQNTNSRVARQIAAGLVDESDVFHLLNRGMTVTAFSAEYDPKKELLCLEVADGYYGVLDGGHTYAVIKENVQPYLANGEESKEERPEFLDAFVRMEILVGIKSDLLVDIARSRNTSAQVKDESLANLEGSFDWLKDVVAKTKFGNMIAYRENEDDSQYPIDIREIVSLLTLFHPNFQDTENPPIMGYASKNRCLELFRKDEEGYKALKPILVNVLEMYDYIQIRFADIYKAIGGFGSLKEDETARKSKGVKLAKVTGVKQIKEGFPLLYTEEKAYYRFPDGWLFPVLASLRGIASYKNTVRWKAEPKAFFDKVGKSLVSQTLEASRSLGRSPNAVGKSKSHWMALHEKVMNVYLRMANTDTDKDIIVK